mgnify:FL=1
MSNSTELVFCVHTKPHSTIVMGACPKTGEEIDDSIEEERLYLEKKYSVRCHVGIREDPKHSHYIEPKIKKKRKMHRKWERHFDNSLENAKLI